MVDAAIILIVFFILIALGVGVYFLMKSGKNKCPDNCSDQSCSNNMCTTCSSGYGIDNKGTPDTDGSCPSYTSSTKCPPNCTDTSCPDSKCTNCNGGSPNADGTCPMSSYSLVPADTSVPSNPYGGACRTSPTSNGTNEFIKPYSTTDTLTDCQNLCSSNKNCTAVSYTPSNKVCALFTPTPVNTGWTLYKDEVCYKKN